jgi:toxin ParE1/3/4
MKTVIFVAGADTDLLEIWLHIAQHNPSAADKALVSIRGICDLLGEHPELGELQPDLLPKLRRFTIENFAVFYRPLVEGVEVLMVLHGSRDSAKALRERLP